MYDGLDDWILGDESADIMTAEEEDEELERVREYRRRLAEEEAALTRGEGVPW